MTKIDTEKFIVSMIQQLMDGHPLKTQILYALLKQGLVYADGSIVRVVNTEEGPSLEEAITNEPVVKRESDPSSTMPCEWSEEEKGKISRICSILGWASDDHAFITARRLIGDKECVELQDFLKSLRPRTHWKPTKDDLECISDAIKHYINLGHTANRLTRLLEQLKKLREEE